MRFISIISLSVLLALSLAPCRAQTAQTIDDTDFVLGSQYSNEGRWQEAIDAFERFIAKYPAAGIVYYRLAYCYLSNGEPDKARSNYEKARELGYELATGVDPLGKAIAGDNSPMDGIALQYTPKFDNPERKHVMIVVTGDTRASEELIADTITGLERLEYVNGRTMFTSVHVEFLETREEGTVSIEKWRLKNDEGERTYKVTYDFTPPAGFGGKTSIAAEEMEGE